MKSVAQLTLLLALSACGKIVPTANHDPFPTLTPSGEDLFTPQAPAANPGCLNPYPLDAWAGLDQQRIAKEEFVNGAVGRYYAYMVDIYATATPVSDTSQAAHLRIYTNDRTDRDATTHTELLCAKNITNSFSGYFMAVDSILRSDGTFTDLWSLEFTVPSLSAFNIQNRIITMPSSQRITEDGGSRADDGEMFFRRSSTQYEWRVRQSESNQDIYASITYLLK